MMVPYLHVHRVKSDQGLSVSDRALERARLVSEVVAVMGAGLPMLCDHRVLPGRDIAT